MTRSPKTIGPGTPLREARAHMREHHIHHLPVVRAGRLVGVVSDRDLQRLGGLRRLGLMGATAGAVMTGNPLVFPSDTPLDEVVTQMRSRRCTSALVTQDHALIGIFTAVDAIEALDDALSGHLPVPRPAGPSRDR